MTAPVQPLMHDEIVVLAAPTQAWSATDGSMGAAPIHGIYHSDVRLVSALSVLVAGAPVEHIAVVPEGASSTLFISIARQLDHTVDPGVRVEQRRTATPTGIDETLTISSRLHAPIETTVTVTLRPDLTDLDHIKAGLPAVGAAAGTTWGNGTIEATLIAPGAEIDTKDAALTLHWTITVPANSSVSVAWTIAASDAAAVVRGATGPAPWSRPTVHSGDERLGRWVTRALDDLGALRLVTTASDEEFLAAGAPWFFTLFGRDSIWAARFMLPLGTGLAASTLRVLAGLQGSTSVDATAEQPGKIMHELRRGTLSIPGEGISLPPLYYGTVDATPLWVCLLHDAWRWGMPDDEVRALLPALTAALEWMRDFGDSDGDGLLEYVDSTGHGLSNQGWKDSGDSVQWRDGALATGPIALCEVQAYAYEAATHGADLLEHFGEGNPAAWRDWAAALREKFAASFWITDAAGAYPAIALDAEKKPVDTVTSNLGHLLGTGLLTPREAKLVAARLVAPTLNSGYGLRTMSTDSAGYWPLSYHGGSVWTHDTAIAISGLSREGFGDEAGSLIEGLLSAASGFDYRMPELHSGDPATAFARPVPYPAACRPQAWSAAAAVSVLASSLGLDPTVDALSVSPVRGSALRVDGLRFGTETVSITVNADGEVTAASGPIEVR